MRQVNTHEAKTNLSALLERTRNGESFIIAKAGKPVALVSPYSEPSTERNSKRTGFLKGAFTVPDDFDTMMQDEITALFEGE
ncbi:MAG: type II toxin-antitoxin system prevent-host-death family antitoxin [Coriobacteriales bacterium]|jgi:prevent-host-death family protein|nr:type II toxin-antitoxin system prevent-host-death family antitoxin [Coriobacteriales bacterium]